MWRKIRKWWRNIVLGICFMLQSWQAWVNDRVIGETSPHKRCFCGKKESNLFRDILDINWWYITNEIRYCTFVLPIYSKCKPVVLFNSCHLKSLLLINLYGHEFVVNTIHWIEAPWTKYQDECLNFWFRMKQSVLCMFIHIDTRPFRSICLFCNE